MLSFAYDPIATQDMMQGDSVLTQRQQQGISTLWKGADANPIIPDTSGQYDSIDWNPKVQLDTNAYHLPVSEVPQPSETSWEQPITKYTPQVASVLGLETTDKTSLGVFEAPVTDESNRTLQNMTLVTDPAVENLQNFRTDNFSSPLGANYTDNTSVVASGQDALGFYTNLTQADVTPPAQDATQPVDTTQAQPSQSWFDYLTTTAGGKSIKGEVTVLLVGVVVLAIGIFALTR